MTPEPGVLSILHTVLPGTVPLGLEQWPEVSNGAVWSLGHRCRGLGRRQGQAIWLTIVSQTVPLLPTKWWPGPVQPLIPSSGAAQQVWEIPAAQGQLPCVSPSLHMP